MITVFKNTHCSCYTDLLQKGIFLQYINIIISPAACFFAVKNLINLQQNRLSLFFPHLEMGFKEKLFANRFQCKTCRSKELKRVTGRIITDNAALDLSI